MEIEMNADMLLAKDYIENTNLNVFLTGNAGTGKTTFLKYLCKNTHKRMAIVAPTGVAAINAGGMTIHSFFQLPFVPYTREFTREYFNVHLREERINVLNKLDLLIIDEISMVRADVLDAINYMLQRFRKRTDRAFGGVQLLMIGDLQQLPPVVVSSEENTLRKEYQTHYFFGSKTLMQSGFVTVRLTKIYRQQDQNFITILNEVRNNVVTPRTLAMLNSRVREGFDPTDSDYIRLTTHNREADEINQSKLNELRDKEYRYMAYISGSFPESSYPVDKEIVLKKGAQVMFTRNNPRYNIFNGKIGVVVKLDENEIIVRCKGGEDIRVQKEEWENLSYKDEKGKGTIEPNVVGTFRQYPLRLAWAITVHKSQGLTFDYAIMDLSRSFSHGQVYVALSRCRTLDGLVLTTPISEHAIINDMTVTNFMNGQEQVAAQVQSQISAYKKDFYLETLNQLFSFTAFEDAMMKFKERQMNGGGFEKKYNFLASTLGTVFEKYVREVGTPARNFKGQYSNIIAESQDIYKDEHLASRLASSAVYFQSKLQEILQADVPITIPEASKILEQDYDPFAKTFHTELRIKERIFGWMKEKGFTPSEYYTERSKAEAEVERMLKGGTSAPQEEEQANPSQKTSESPYKLHPLYHTLREWRRQKAGGNPLYTIISNKTIDGIIEDLPTTKGGLLDVNGISENKYEQYGAEIIAMVSDYLRSSGETKPVRTKEAEDGKAQTKKKSDKKELAATYLETLGLLNEGNTAADIAALRGLNVTTIYGHFHLFVAKGLRTVEQIVGRKTLDKIVAISEVDADFTPECLVEQGIAKDMGEAIFFAQMYSIHCIADAEKKKEIDEKYPSNKIDRVRGMIKDAHYSLCEIVALSGLMQSEIGDAVRSLMNDGEIALSDFLDEKDIKMIANAIPSAEDWKSLQEVIYKLPYRITMYDVSAVRKTISE